MANTFGLYNPNSTLNDQGIKNYRSVFFNLNEDELFEAAIQRSEGVEGIGGSLLVKTGKFTGRSPNDKYIVFSKSSESEIWWDNNAQMKAKYFNRLHADMLDFINDKELFVQDLYAGADPDHRINVRVISELVWHNLFMRHLLIKPDPSDLNSFYSDFNIINIPSFKANPKKHGCRSETAIAINLDAKLVLIAGTEYGGENKKAVFTILNYLLPKKGILPMHCAANRVSDQFSASAIFFGLSGTGKTTLSTDGKRVLIGDDEHGWSDNGLFNFEGGCYAKTFGLSAETEPEIFATTTKFATVIENMVYDEETKKLDFFDSKLTANMRAAYPMHYVTRSAIDGLGEHPKYLIMLTCDAFGVLPPISKLSPDQAAYHFISGYTAKVAGTEIGVKEPQATFSACFGEPFMPMHPGVYADLLAQKMEEHNATAWLINTGWSGGPYGVGNRMKIKYTRAMLNAALDGDLDNVEYVKDSRFGFAVPTSCPGVPSDVLQPIKTWNNSDDYHTSANNLASMFIENFKRYQQGVSEAVNASSPKPLSVN